MPTPRHRNTGAQPPVKFSTSAIATPSQKAASLATAYQQQQQVDREIYRSIFQSNKPPTATTTIPSHSTPPLTSELAASSTDPLLPDLPAARPSKPQPISGLWWTAALFIALSHALILSLCLLTLRTSYRLPSIPLLALTAVQSWLQLLGITAGYHRLWSHGSYRASTGLRLFLAVIGAQAFQGSGYWWALRHRLHHRFTDTENDPHSINVGFWWAHVGWLFWPPPRFSKLALVGCKDLADDWVLMWQRRWLLVLYVVFGLLYPAAAGWLLVGGWAGAWQGALYVGVVARLVSWHCIWSINSVSHYYGAKHFSLRSTAVRTPALVQLLQNGEGHHNMHHEFPRDYAHGRGAYDWDPTKWCIQVWCALGWASERYLTNNAAIKAARIEVLLEKAARLQAGHPSASPPSPPVPLQPTAASLPGMSLSTFRRLTAAPSSLPLLVYGRLVLDAGGYAAHPGGQSLLRAYYGRDATEAMSGGVNLHTEAAGRMARGMAVARVVEEGEEEGWAVGGGGACERNVLVAGAAEDAVDGEGIRGHEANNIQMEAEEEKKVVAAE